jgi:hypothetical protein
VFTPPFVLLNLGIPPANNPPSCGGPEAGSEPLRCRDAFESLLALAAGLGAAAEGIGGAAKDGIGGAPKEGALLSVGLPAIVGADRSLVTAFFSLIPLAMSLLSAPW